MTKRALFLLLGFMSLGLYGGLALLSQQFIYGQGHLERPILFFIGLYLLAFLLYTGAIWAICSLPAQRQTLLLIFGFALAFRGSLLLSSPIQEDDFYRYLWDGQVVASGLNPYSYAPQEVWEYEEQKSGKQESLAQLSQIAKADPVFATILSRVNHSWIPTIYPPLAEGVLGIAAMLGPGNLTALRLVFIAFDLGTAFLLVSLLLHLRQKPTLVLIYAWSPLVVKEVVNSAHYDALPSFFTCLAFLFVLKKKEVLGYASLALAVLAKGYPLVFVPVFALRSYWRQGTRATVYGLLCVAMIIGVGYAPFFRAGVGLWQGTLTYAQEWKMNSLLFPLVLAMVEDRWLANAVVIGALGLCLLLLLRRFDVRADDNFLWVGFLVVGVLFLLSPVGNPWYFIWVVPFLCLFPLRSWILLSGLLSLYYLAFYFLYRGTPQVFQWFIWLEYLPFFAVLLWEIWGRSHVDKRQMWPISPLRFSARGTSKCLMLALAFFFLGLMEPRAAGSVDRAPTPETPLIVNKEEREVRVYAVIYPRRFNAAGDEEAHYHFLVWSGGTSKGAFMETPANDLAFYEAMIAIGGKPGDNLPMTAWTQRHNTHSSTPEQRVEGSAIAVSLAWEGKETGIPIHEAFQDKDMQDLSWRFGGNRQRWFNFMPFAQRPGCLACLYSCPSGKIGNHAFTVRDYVDKPVRFMANLATLPPDGTLVVVTFRLSP